MCRSIGQWRHSNILFLVGTKVEGAGLLPCYPPPSWNKLLSASCAAVLLFSITHVSSSSPLPPPPFPFLPLFYSGRFRFYDASHPFLSIGSITALLHTYHRRLKTSSRPKVCLTECLGGGTFTCKEIPPPSSSYQCLPPPSSPF